MYSSSTSQKNSFPRRPQNHDIQETSSDELMELDFDLIPSPTAGPAAAEEDDE